VKRPIAIMAPHDTWIRRCAARVHGSEIASTRTGEEAVRSYMTRTRRL